MLRPGQGDTTVRCGAAKQHQVHAAAAQRGKGAASVVGVHACYCGFLSCHKECDGNMWAISSGDEVHFGTMAEASRAASNGNASIALRWA